jgi:hypothetical protein
MCTSIRWLIVQFFIGEPQSVWRYTWHESADLSGLRALKKYC